jgi:hypothetical protein
LPDGRNPLEPDPDNSLQLTFDGRSLSAISEPKKNDAEVLLSLRHTPVVEWHIAWSKPGFAADLPAAERGQAGLWSRA